MYRNQSTCDLASTKELPMARFNPALPILLVTAIVTLAVCTPELTAQSPIDRHSSSFCCQYLLYPIGARAVALGNALVARAHVDALYVNPAALAHPRRTEFRVHSDRTDVNSTTTFGATLTLGPAGAAGIGYRLVDEGTIPAIDEFDNPTGSMSTYDQMVAVSYATPLGPHVDVGVTYMFYQWRSDCTGYCGPFEFGGSTSLVDVGLRVAPPWIPSLQLGIAGLHLGMPLQVHNAAQSDRTPSILRFGAAYELLHHLHADSTTQFLASVDIVRGIENSVEESVGFGIELVMDDCLFLRTGYSTTSGKGSGGAVGVGMIWDRFEVSVGKSFSINLDGSEAFQVSFAIGL
jgi:hypothetical protein